MADAARRTENRSPISDKRCKGSVLCYGRTPVGPGLSLQSIVSATTPYAVEKRSMFESVLFSEDSVLRTPHYRLVRITRRYGIPGSDCVMGCSKSQKARTIFETGMEVCTGRKKNYWYIVRNTRGNLTIYYMSQTRRDNPGTPGHGCGEESTVPDPPLDLDPYK
ncbi:hypothetical protein L209DRAFT_245270 [Thermothelomyces heterothallicus CBS 203.75]